METDSPTHAAVAGSPLSGLGSGGSEQMSSISAEDVPVPSACYDDPMLPAQNMVFGDLSRATAVVEQAVQLEREQAERDQQLREHQTELVHVQQRLGQMEGALAAERRKSELMEQVVRDALNRRGERA